MKFIFTTTCNDYFWEAIIERVINLTKQRIVEQNLESKEMVVQGLFVRLRDILKGLTGCKSGLIRDASTVILIIGKDEIFTVTVEEEKLEVDKKFRRMEPHELIGQLCFQSYNNGKDFDDVGGRGGLRVDHFTNENLSFWKLNQ